MHASHQQKSAKTWLAKESEDRSGTHIGKCGQCANTCGGTATTTSTPNDRGSMPEPRKLSNKYTEVHLPLCSGALYALVPICGLGVVLRAALQMLDK